MTSHLIGHPLPTTKPDEIRQICEHDDCTDYVVADDYCETHHEHYICECGTRLEDAHGTPGDGFCARCR